jgi:hypothetical protein
MWRPVSFFLLEKIGTQSTIPGFLGSAKRRQQRRGRSLCRVEARANDFGVYISTSKQMPNVEQRQTTSRRMKMKYGFFFIHRCSFILFDFIHFCCDWQ